MVNLRSATLWVIYLQAFLALAGWGGTVGMVLVLTAVSTVLAVAILPRD